MRITDLLDSRSVDVNGVASSKEDAINKMVELMCKSGKISDREEYRRRDRHSPCKVQCCK